MTEYEFHDVAGWRDRGRDALQLLAPHPPVVSCSPVVNNCIFV